MKAAMIVMAAAALNAVSVVEASIATADFTKDVGPVRPELHSSGFGPTICSQTSQDLADVKAMILDYTHDLVPYESTQTRDQVHFTDGKLVIWKPDFFSAAFFITFD